MIPPLASVLIVTPKRSKWSHWHPIAEFFVCLFACAVLVVAAWVVGVVNHG